MLFGTKMGIAGGIIGIFVIVGLFWSIFSKNSASQADFFTVSTRTVTQRVSVTGKVAPFEKADLGFESAGTLASKNFKVGDRVKVGDVIASLDTSGAYASLSGAQASYASEAAKLEDLAKGLRPEEVTVEETKVQNAQTAYADAQQSMSNAIRDAYTKTTSAVLNYTDAFYQNAQTAAPLIVIHTESTMVRDRANDGRVLLTDMFRNWKNKIDANASLPDLVAETKKNLDTTKSFLGLMTSIVSTISTGNSGATQSVIDGYNLTLNSAYTNLNSALVGVTAADTSLKSASSSLALALNEYDLKKAGSSPEALAAQQAKVEQSLATVDQYRSILSKSKILSPLDGIVTRADPEVGEFVAAGKITFGVMSDQSFKIEVYVPEMDIAKIAVGNTASVTLDAYGDGVVFPASVTLIDPAETIVEGVPTYKVTLRFDAADARIRSGMTANIDIVTARREGVVAVPVSAVADRVVGDAKQKFVRVEVSGSVVERPVQTGVRGSDGYVEIVSGLSIGDRVATFAK